MSTKRIDIRMDYSSGNARVKVIPIQCSGKITELGQGEFLFVTGSWKIKISDKQIKIYCDSKAIKKRNRFNIATRVGSLFLYNSTNNWYWYFRQKRLQDILDYIQVDSMKICDYDDTVSIPCCFDYTDDIYSESKVNGSPTIKFAGPGVQASIDENEILMSDENNSVRVAMIKFKIKSFVIIEFLDNHRKIYLKSGVKVEDLYRNNMLDNISMKSVLTIIN